MRRVFLGAVHPDELDEKSRDVHGGSGLDVVWKRPEAQGDRRRLGPWAAGVGPPITAVQQGRSTAGSKPSAGLTVVTWNARAGGGALRALWEHVREIAPHGPLVLLLQEVYSAGDHIPHALPLGAVGAGAITDEPPGEPRTDIGTFASEAGLFLFYTPSMRNGPGPEDRGNAVLADVPLSGLTAIELPFERQRRVAAVAGVNVGAATLRVCSLHLDNRATWDRAWRSLGLARTRQMAGLLDSLGSESPCALGGDFNTWVRGTREGAYALARKRFPRPQAVDSRPTHHFELGGVLRRSDHLLFDLPGKWRCRVERLDDTFGSDHYPLMGYVDVEDQ